MKSLSHNTFLQYALVACLGIALTVGQTFRLHMHVLPENGHPGYSMAEHLGKIHIASLLHDSLANDADGQAKDHSHHNHPGEVEIGSDSIIKKTEVLVLAALIFLITALLLFGLHVSRIVKRAPEPNKLNTSLLYLINPPLRAPPVRLSI
ncbi:MAG: hypothetical protein GC149_13325 [Gammaproteobacteria bacterium]|nr:hypothetical protein [Gammaproteobacteria bacterium]